MGFAWRLQVEPAKNGDESDFGDETDFHGEIMP